MPRHSLQDRVVEVIAMLAATPDGLAGFRGYRGETYTVTPQMVEQLRTAETRVRRLRRDIEQQLADAEARPCAKCRKPVTGRPDRQYCSDRCRQAAHRQRHGPKITDPATMAPSRQRETS